MYVFVGLGVQVGSRLCLYSSAGQERRGTALRARQSSESWPATADGNGGLSKPIESLRYRKIGHKSSEAKDKAGVRVQI